MQTQHTPGPWHVTTWPGDADVPDGCSLGIDDESGAAGGRDYYLATVVHGDPEELRANARLIAAAPDLLAALQEARSMVYHMTGDSATCAPWNALLPRLDAAIARATGQ